MTHHGQAAVAATGIVGVIWTATSAALAPWIGVWPCVIIADMSLVAILVVYFIARRAAP